MTTLVVTRGIQGSGKSTRALAWVAEDPASRARVSRDQFRVMFAGTDTERLTGEQENRITTAVRASVRALLSAGCDVVVDEMSLRPRYIRDWEKLAYELGCEVEVWEFPIDVATAIDRDFARGRKVGPAVILKTAEKYLPGGKFLPHEPFVPDAEEKPAFYGRHPDLPSAVIVDIDGTVALNTGGRGWYDYDRVHEDTPNEGVVQMVRAARTAGLKIIYCSGRSEDCRDITEEWLAKHTAGDRNYREPLFMRASGDRRKDSIVKRELFDAHIRGVYDIAYVLDDRNQVVDMWRSLGLTVAQVAPGDF